MNFGRAQEIVNSPVTIEVLYDGKPIWIEELNPVKQTALVSSGAFKEQRMTVPVNQLAESTDSL